MQNRNDNNTPTIEFWGAAGTVTGSKYLVNTGTYKVLIDCGLFQGEKEVRSRNWDRLPFPLDDLDAVILTHAHLDHSGFLPVLRRQGFKGSIHSTEATADLCAILLPDSGYIQEKDAENANRYKYSKHKPAKPLYNRRDAVAVLDQFKTHAFHKDVDLAPGVHLKFYRAGHILGAAIVTLRIGGRRLVFSGDLGRQNSVTMPKPDMVGDVDYLIVESTYGDRMHVTDDPEVELENIVNPVARAGGTIIIPSFAVGRAQTLLYHLYNLKRQNRIPEIPVFLDSPMAINASNVFCAHPHDHIFRDLNCQKIFDVASYVQDVKQSKFLTTSPFPKIIISASGMATGGRVLHHLKSYIGDAKNAIVFAGFQARGTRGDKLVNGAEFIRIHGTDYAVKAPIHTLDMLSAHADVNEVMEWMSLFDSAPKKVFITHGEPNAALGLKSRIEKDLEWKSVIPKYGDKFSLD